jgi:hypothetical protein
VIEEWNALGQTLCAAFLEQAEGLASAAA